MNSKGIKRIPSYIGGLFAVMAGTFFIVAPEISAGFIGIMLGVILFVAGISEVIGYIISIKQFREENYGKAAGAEIILVYSLGIMAIGIFLILKTDTVLLLLSAFVGIFFLIDGIVKARRVFFLFSLKDFNWWMLLLLAIALIAAGIALLINPFENTRNIIVFTGLCFVISGIQTCCTGLYKKAEK